MSYKGAPLMSKSQKWTTPLSFIKWLENKLYSSIELDVCADENNHKAPRYFTEEDNALKQNWIAEHAFMNPPFELQLQFFEHAIDQVMVENTCHNLWALVPARTDTKLFHDLIIPNAHAIYFIKGRFKFGGHNNVKGSNAPFPSMLVHFTCYEDDEDAGDWILNKPLHSNRASMYVLDLDKKIRGF